MSEDAKVAEELYRTLGEVRAQLTAEREAAAKDREDAERYRWLRNQAIFYGAGEDSHKTPWCVFGVDVRDADPIDGQWLDDEIDICMGQP